jgi:guanosine-3',5'-bis(diphosphate) 3'-pyrophosphohydrolase
MNAITLVLRATSFAAHKHRDQRRKGEEASPYINHPIAVAAILADEAGIDDAVVLAAALLHDTVEDTDTTLGELKDAFGAQIAGIVAEMTDDKTLPKTERKRLQIEHAPLLSTQAKLVKLADKIANLRDMNVAPPVDWPLTRRQQYFEWGYHVVAGLRGAHPRLEALFDAEYGRRPQATPSKSF